MVEEDKKLKKKLFKKETCKFFLFNDNFMSILFQESKKKFVVQGFLGKQVNKTICCFREKKKFIVQGFSGKQTNKMICCFNNNNNNLFKKKLFQEQVLKP